MYFYISIFLSDIFFSNTDDIKNDYNTTPTHVTSEFKFNLLEYYVIDINRTQNILVDSNTFQRKSELLSLVEKSTKDKFNEYTGRTMSSDILNNFLIYQLPTQNEFYYQNNKLSFEDNIYTNDVISHSRVTDDSKVAVSDNAMLKVDKTIIHEFITNPQTRDRNYKINTHPDNYGTIAEIFNSALWVSKKEGNCSLADYNEITLKDRALHFINFFGLSNNTSIDDTISFIKFFNDIYESLKPCEFDGKLYKISVDCLNLELSQKALQEYYEVNTGLITIEYLTRKIKCICPNILNIVKFKISYRKITYPSDLLELIENIKRRISDKNDLIHKSSNPISDFCSKIISNSKIANFIINNHLAIDYILCKIRNIFNVQDTKNKDYLASVDILNSLIKITSQTPNITNLSSLTTISGSTQSINEDQNSSSKSEELSSIQIGLICGGVILGVLILVGVSILIYKKFRK